MLYLNDDSFMNKIIFNRIILVEGRYYLMNDRFLKGQKTSE